MYTLRYMYMLLRHFVFIQHNYMYPLHTYLCIHVQACNYMYMLPCSSIVCTALTSAPLPSGHRLTYASNHISVTTTRASYTAV